jgi:hypothetical protein
LGMPTVGLGLLGVGIVSFSLMRLALKAKGLCL